MADRESPERWVLVIERSLLEHVVSELLDRRSAKPMERGDGAVARDPIADGPARHGNAVLRCDAARDGFLRVPQVVEADRACDQTRWIFDSFEAGKG